MTDPTTAPPAPDTLLESESESETGAGPAAAPATTQDLDPDGTAVDIEEAGDAGTDLSPLEQEGEIAADYLEGLLDIADLDGDIDMDVEGSRAAVSVVGPGLGHLVGPGGTVLDALQELTRLAVQTQTGDRSRLMLDVAGHRAQRRLELSQLGAAAAVRAAAGERVVLEPMTAFERKVVHDAVASAGLRSESEGEDPNRRVVVLPGTSGE